MWLSALRKALNVIFSLPFPFSHATCHSQNIGAPSKDLRSTTVGNGPSYLDFIRNDQISQIQLGFTVKYGPPKRNVQKLNGNGWVSTKTTFIILMVPL